MARYPEPEQICRQILKAAGHTGPPTDLVGVCSLWPKLAIVEEDLDKEGYLVPLGIHGADLMVRKKDPLTRKRFTVAHELGHWVLAHLECGILSLDGKINGLVSFQPEHKRQTPEEKWCNEFAASLLMPVDDLRAYLQDHLWELGLHIANGHLVFNVSPEALFLRVAGATRISVIEVVDFGSTFRLRRQFISNQAPINEPQELIDQLANQFRIGDLLQGSPLILGDLTIYVEKARSSNTLMLCIVPSGIVDETVPQTARQS